MYRDYYEETYALRPAAYDRLIACEDEGRSLPERTSPWVDHANPPAHIRA